MLVISAKYKPHLEVLAGVMKCWYGSAEQTTLQIAIISILQLIQVAEQVAIGQDLQIQCSIN